MSDFCHGRPMLDRIFRHAELMDRVMERLGIDPSVAARLDRDGLVGGAHTLPRLSRRAAMPALVRADRPGFDGAAPMRHG